MKSLKRQFNNDRSTTSIEVILVRAYVVFDLAEKLLTLTVAQLHELGQKLGWW